MLFLNSEEKQKTKIAQISNFIRLRLMRQSEEEEVYLKSLYANVQLLMTFRLVFQISYLS